MVNVVDGAVDRFTIYDGVRESDHSLRRRLVCVTHRDMVVYTTPRNEGDMYCRSWHHREQASCVVRWLWVEDWSTDDDDGTE